MGVRRAVELAERELFSARAGSSGGAKVYSLGPLIHNPQVLEKLKAGGLEILDDVDLSDNPDLAGAVVILRAHGVRPDIEDDLAKRGARIVDATCPRVKASQMKAKALAEAGRRIFLAGEENHGEIAGIRGYAPSCVVVGNAEEAERAAEKIRHETPDVKTALVGQTTITPAEYRAIGDGITKYFPDLEIIDTICSAVRDRQDALRSLCGKVEAVIIAGGKSSANTRRLLAAARESGRPAWLAETAADIPSECRRFDVVGICAGASTPDEVIDGIEQDLLNGETSDHCDHLRRDC
jgi:4-hydroxy-3-methylbut-2-enyl diphosphate reductase